MGGPTLDLSEMFVVRKIYLKKAEKYLRYHGKIPFTQGSLGHDVLWVVEHYGLMPEQAYSGMPGKTHNHTDLVKDLKEFLDTQLEEGIDPHWQTGFQAIMDQHLGIVPAVFQFNGSRYNARSFADFCRINPNDYVGFTSFDYKPYGEKIVVEVPDNFSDGQYFNLTLDSLVMVTTRALKNGYSVEWDGDVSEPGFKAREGTAELDTTVTPELRQHWFDNHRTTDDHLMHFVGLKTEEDGSVYFWVKNSWGTQSGYDGFLVMDHNYFRAKTICIIIHKNALLDQ
jgi:bleomycin hydrolase